MYEAMDQLHANIEEIERAVFFNTANLFNLEVDLIFYDTTTASFHVDSEDNRAELAKACGKYLLACRMASVSEIKREVLCKRGRYTKFKDNLHAKEVIIGDGERRNPYILCYTPKESKRQSHHRQMIVELLEGELSRQWDHSVAAQWVIELLVSRRFIRYLRITKAGLYYRQATDPNRRVFVN
jgi:hypothetical protein